MPSAVRNPESTCFQTSYKNKTANHPSNPNEIEGALDTRKSEPDIVMPWAVTVLCFFGFFQTGKITIPTISGFEDSKHLAWGDVAIDDVHNSQSLRVHLKRSKTDQLGKVVDVYIGKTDGLLCSVMVVMAYTAVQGLAPGSFFKLANGHPLIKSSFTNKIRAGLQAVGLLESNFAGHSFQIGTATAVANAGIENSVIRTLGRWSSSAFLTYIRTPREQMARFSATLAAS